ncbi:MAG: RICIN domain-containing protein [Mucilaginibacter sp.]
MNFKLPIVSLLILLCLQGCAKTAISPAQKAVIVNPGSDEGLKLMNVNGIYTVLKITELASGTNGQTKFVLNRTLSDGERDWQIVKLDKTYFKILNAVSGKALTVVESNKEPVLSDYTGAATQMWSVRAVESSNVVISSKGLSYALTLNTTTKVYPNPDRSYQFSGTMPRNVLESYLSRSMQMYEYCKKDGLTQFGNAIPNRDDDKRMILNTGAKFIGRAIFSFGEDEKFSDPEFIGYAKERITDLHNSDSDIIVQGCIFEIVTTKINNISMPDWVFTTFGQTVITRNFNYNDMLYSSGSRVNQWGTGQSVPDITKLETRMWFYWLAKQYIDAGIEALHFGQVELMAEEDKKNDYAGWKDILGKVRAYAAVNARRQMVICDGHVPSGALKDAGGNLLLDFNSFPLRPKEDGPQAQHNTVLEIGYSDSFYGRSQGGITPSGWSCDHLPYLVELDSYGNTSHIGAAGPEQYDVWGYDEMWWFATQSEVYRNQWLNYARKRVNELDPNGFVIMPGAIAVGIYRANTKSPACPAGGNGEETIKMMWKNFQ